MIKEKSKSIMKRPAMVLALGFAIMITIGGLALSRPAFSQSGQASPMIDSFFVAGSASCVTGLTPVNTANHWNFKGKVLILILIQIGGVGIMTAATAISLFLRRRVGLDERKVIKDSFNLDSFSGLMTLSKYTPAFTLIVEAIGAGLLALAFVPVYGLKKGIFFSIFHSISAFCNAGFDITGDSMVPFNDNALVNITLMALVVIGGLGFIVSYDIYKTKSFKKLTVQSKLVLLLSGGLIVAGALAIFILEYDNPGTLAGQSFKGKTLQAFFQSVVARTAGFYSVDLSQLRLATVLVICLLMFIGGSPGSTAGGIKTTTFAVLALTVRSVIRGEDKARVFNKQIGTKTVRNSLALALVYQLIIIIIVLLITIIEDFALEDNLFEVVSALATVGSSRGITPELSLASKVLLIFSMYAGRLGPITLAYAFAKRSNKNDKNKLNYPEARIAIG